MLRTKPLWAVAAGLLTLPLLPTPATAAPATLRVISWNICGEAGGDRGDAGYCPYRNEPGKKVKQIAGLVAEHQANVVLLQEVCGVASDSHLELLKAALGSGWSFARADGARPDGRVDCRGSLSGNLGLGIAVKSQITDTKVTQTLPPDPTGKSKQTLPTLCVRTASWAETRICTTHVLADPVDPRRPQQVKNIKTAVSAGGLDVVLGGDFNLFPGSAELKPLSSAYEECDAAGAKRNEVTHHAWTNGKHVYRKRDHIFAAKAGTSRRFTACDADQSLMDTTANEADSGRPSGYSDHAPLIGYLPAKS
ncbi:endonuclease/exonuclease/phosphatase family protein [Nonomuraea sp. KC401]|uniref:endonuclease/exonuclease/phosphatase family protein n=1 Tax=unclassified Nonomuraea TaxID=2593643 RepID=UPI0010FDBA53|nr:MULTISPECIES: endonuclease/exonuclease/phosphatase family protein [unclassified Nonomuraea]NBE93200.1 endonuclease/exonuclease/phosphatase family protein [Nonomuraea sp. K271]TLF82825.1 endonuclease/exonuclease/phosphatase family protein [Nonomuraea sp. KC401]